MTEDTSLNETYIILNPNAAKGKAVKQADVIAACFSERNWNVTFVLTTAERHAIALAREAVHEGHRLIVAAGGDGTMNEVVNGIMLGMKDLGLTPEEGPKMGLIPIGRGNDFAFAAGIPKNIKEACEIIMEGHSRPIDIGVVYGGLYPEGRYFANGVGVGFEPLVNFTAMEFKHVSGMPSYVLALIKILLHYPKAIPIMMTHDNGEAEFTSQQISICNGRRMGSAFIMGPNAIIDDGMLDICYANAPIKGWQLVPYVLLFFKGTQVKKKRFTTLRTTTIKIATPEAQLQVHADGEVIAKGCPEISIALEHHGLYFYSPSAKNAG